MAALFSVLGNGQKLDGGAMFGNAPRSMWEKWMPPDELGRITLACRAFLIQENGKNILLETGIGAFFEPKLALRFGVENSNRHILLENLTALGLKEDDIHVVILSHLHFDHAGGLLTPHGTPDRLLFPNARYVVGKEAWQRCISPHSRDRASFIPGLSEKLLNSKRLHIVGGGTAPEVCGKNIRFLLSDGHTPGQLHTIYQGSHNTAFFCGDLVPGKSWLHIPITMGYDRFPERVIDEKTSLYEEALSHSWILLFTHDPDISGARAHKDSSKVTTQEEWPVFSGFEL